MNNSDVQLFFGGVEQALAGGVDPLNPPISVSCNGTLAKWRGKFQFQDLRVNDPGLRDFPQKFEEMCLKSRTLGIETILTLPEFVPRIFDIPPGPPPPPPADPRAAKRNPRFQALPRQAVAFRRCSLAVPRTVGNPDEWESLSVDDCLPILELASRHEIRRVVIPVSEPGRYLDPEATEEFKDKVSNLVKAGSSHGITFHLRNGGLTRDLFRQMQKKMGCRLALNLGTAHLEREDLLGLYEEFRGQIDLMMFHQVQPGMDKLEARREALRVTLAGFITRLDEWRQVLAAHDSPDIEVSRGLLQSALRDYQFASKSESTQVGLFQSGDINLVPLLKMIRRDLEAGIPRYLLLETVPNMKNMEFLVRYLLPDMFSGKI